MLRKFAYCITLIFYLAANADAQTVYRYYFDGFNPPGIDRDYAIQEFKNACIRWERVCNVKIIETKDPKKGDHKVATSPRDSVASYIPLTGTIVFTTVDHRTGETYNWSKRDNLFEIMAVHELGHMLFQGSAWKRWHSPNRYDVMYAGGGPLRITDETAQIAARIHGNPKATESAKEEDVSEEASGPPRVARPKPVIYQCPEIAWDEIPGGGRYELWVNFVSPNGEQKGRVIYKKRMHDTMFSFSGFDPGKYRCWVRAELRDGFSPWSDEFVVEVTGEIE